jgi:hypothetical protein
LNANAEVIKQNQNERRIYAMKKRSRRKEMIEILIEATKMAEEKNPQFADTDSEGILFDKLEDRILRYPADKKDTSYTIPVGITAIGDDAFLNCKSLTVINIPDSVISIGDGAFCGCQNLTAINIPAGVTAIRDKAFSGCQSLTAINIPDSVTAIGDEAFLDCKSLRAIDISASVTTIGDKAFFVCQNLTTINIPGNVTVIGDETFLNCQSLTAINIPAGVTSIGDRAFLNCQSLTAINIPAGVTSIGEEVFLFCKSLSNITVKKQNPCFADINGVLFDRLENRILCYPAGKNDVSYTIPAGVTSIRKDAFYGCDILKTVHLSRKVSIPEKDFFKNMIQFVYTD